MSLSTLTRVSCSDFRQFIDCYLDAEIDARDRATFDAHMAACGPCRAHLDNQIAFRQALRPHLRPTEMLPFEARARIRRALAEAERPSRLAAWAKRLALPVPALGAAFGIWLLVVPTTGFVVREAVTQHGLSVPVEIPSGQADEIEAWFKDKLGFELTAPRFQDERVHLLGGRLTRVGGQEDPADARPAAYLVYGIGRHKVTVLAFRGTEHEPLKGGDVYRVNGHEMSLLGYHGLQVATFRDAGVDYAVTSDLPAPDMLRLVGSAF